MNGAITPSPTDPDDRRKHLDFIQATVLRMSAASSAAKGWVLPVVVASYGYALTKESSSVAMLGAVAVLLFASLDAHYLRQEKAFRRLYDAVARGNRNVPEFSMNPADADGPVSGANSGLRQRLSRWVPGPGVWFSWSIAPFYGGLLIVGLAVVGRIR